MALRDYLPELSLLTHVGLPVRLSPSDLHATALDGIHGHTFADVEGPARAFAEFLLPLVLPISEYDLQYGIPDYVSRARASNSLRKVIKRSESQWVGVIVATSIECWVLGVKFGETSSAWDTETLRAAARVLRSSKRPRGIAIEADRLASTAHTLDRLAYESDLLRARASAGRPKDIATLIFNRLEGPLQKVPKIDRARLTSGLLADLGGIASSAENIIHSDKAAAKRVREARRKKQESDEENVERDRAASAAILDRLGEDGD